MHTQSVRHNTTYKDNIHLDKENLHKDIQNTNRQSQNTHIQKIYTQTDSINTDRYPDEHKIDERAARPSSDLSE